jgi:glycosyltransferase involved in cell wall biosynthesis
MTESSPVVAFGANAALQPPQAARRNATTIAALIPTYNRSRMLRECLDSVLSQTRQVDEIIVIDDGSTDDTERVVRSYGGRVRLLSRPNGGKASALNAALPLCQSDYIWICDDDDIAVPDGVRHLAERLDTDESLGWVYGTFKRFSDDGAVRSFGPPTHWRRPEEPNLTLCFLEEMFTFQFAMLVRRSLYIQVGPFRDDLIRSQDYDMAIRLSRSARSAFVPQTIFFQREHAGTRGSARETIAADAIELKWLAYDQAIFFRLRADLSLREFTPSFALHWHADLATRAALIQRACVFANRALWTEAVADFASAGAMNTAALTQQEKQLAEAVIHKTVVWPVLRRAPDLIAGLRRCYRAGRPGRDIVFAFSRPLGWYARALFRQGNLNEGLRTLLLLVHIVGVDGAIRRLAISLIE